MARSRRVVETKGRKEGSRQASKQASKQKNKQTNKQTKNDGKQDRKKTLTRGREKKKKRKEKKTRKGAGFLLFVFCSLVFSLSAFVYNHTLPSLDRSNADFKAVDAFNINDWHGF